MTRQRTGSNGGGVDGGANARMRIFLGEPPTKDRLARNKAIDEMVAMSIGTRVGGGFFPNPMLSVTQAEFVSGGISARRIRALISEGRIKAHRAGGLHMIFTESLQEFLLKPRFAGVRGQMELHQATWHQLYGKRGVAVNLQAKVAKRKKKK